MPGAALLLRCVTAAQHRSSTEAEAEAEASCGTGHRGLDEPADDDGWRGERRQELTLPPALSGAPRASRRRALPTMPASMKVARRSEAAEHPSSTGP